MTLLMVGNNSRLTSTSAGLCSLRPLSPEYVTALPEYVIKFTDGIFVTL